MDFNHTIYDLEELIRVCHMLKHHIEISDRMWFFKSYHRCFVASEAVVWLMKDLGWSEEQAVFFGRLLRTRHLIHHVDNSEIKFGNDSNWWRFQSHEEGPLNWKEIWILTIDEAPAELASQLYKHLLLIVQSVLPSNTRKPSEIINNLKTLESNTKFIQWEFSTSVLQKVLLSIP
eukprot:TRINITY_DN1566_c0_g1_i4.p1 TRINITY_DN1566_c0_g1~~TRINITY_DN1566_c0_g1_i4.p1  ORF type:complete len:175 (+),score=13.11 TRINITY_DN1566_c0_g1_i4:230-754(+)